MYYKNNNDKYNILDNWLINSTDKLLFSDFLNLTIIVDYFNLCNFINATCFTFIVTFACFFNYHTVSFCLSASWWYRWHLIELTEIWTLLFWAFGWKLLLFFFRIEWTFWWSVILDTLHILLHYCRVIFCTLTDINYQHIFADSAPDSFADGTQHFSSGSSLPISITH